MFAVGIDLGTTTSLVAMLKGRPTIVEDFTGNAVLPSAVGWDPDLEQLIVGVDAKSNPDLYNTILSIKRKMGTEERVRIGPHQWLPEEVSAEILKVLKRTVEERTGEQVTEAVITVPAYFQMAAMAATKRAGELADLQVQQLLAEPSAAVMAYGPQDDERILVYDLGGGTFDVTVVDYFAGVLTVKAVFGNNRLGGDDFDRRVMNHLVDVIKRQHGVSVDLENDRFAYGQLKKHAEAAKHEMTRKPGARINIPKVVESQGRPIGLETVIKTEDFNAMIRDLVQGSLVEVEKALNHAELDKSDIDTILLVGGSSYVPLVQKTVKDFFGKEPNKAINPVHAVALGAAASLVLDKPPEGGRHVVTVGFIPEATPETELEIEGRTSPRSSVRITGGQGTAEARADDEGFYQATVSLKPGMNSFVITATAPDGRRATLNPEPVVLDPNARTMEAPPAPPQPRLARGLAFSCQLTLDSNRVITDYASLILEPQTELPCSFSRDSFGTNRDDQRELWGEILEGDLPIDALNTKLAEIKLQLPPNIPAGAQVIVHFTVDDNFVLTAELEVPSVNRKGKVIVDLKSATAQVHVFQQLEDLLTRLGDRLRPEERAALQQSRVALEDLSEGFRRSKEADDSDGMWNSHNRMVAEAKRLQDKMADVRRRLA